MRSIRPNRGRTVYDVVDGQVLLIRSDTGAYYSMTGTAAQAWAAIMATGDESAVVAALDAAHPGTPGIAADVAAFVDALLRDELVEEGLLPEGAAEVVEVPVAPAYAPPVTEAFTDMQDLLLFDPIHDVGPEGWPYADADRG